MATRSYWLETLPADLRQPGTPPPARITCDVAVVGGGYVGAYTALRLREQGARVAVLDAIGPVQGASGRSAGMALTGLAVPYVDAIQALGRETARQAWQLTIHNRALLLDAVERLEIPLVERSGSLVLAGTADEADALKRSAPLLREDGVACTYHAADPLNRGYLAALEYPHDVGIHPALVSASILRASGAATYAPAQVTHWHKRSSGVVASGARFEVCADTLVIATNARASELVPSLAGLIHPVRGQVLVTAPLPARVIGTLAYADAGYQYFRQLPDGRLLIGGCRLADREAEVGFADQTTRPIQDALERYLARIFPEAAGLPVEQRWSGSMGFTPDGLPLVGQAGARVFYAAGFSGHGFSTGLATVERLLALMLHGQAPGILAANRFPASVLPDPLH